LLCPDEDYNTVVETSAIFDEHYFAEIQVGIEPFNIMNSYGCSMLDHWHAVLCIQLVHVTESELYC